MSRPQDKSNGLPTEGQAAQQGTQAAGPGTTAGAAATGTAGTGTTATPGTTTTGVRDRSGATHEQSSTTTGYQRGSAPAASHRGGGTASMTGGVLAVVAGLLTFLAGLAAVVRQHFYPVLSGYAYTWNVRNWGWVLLVLGVLLFAAGACALLGMAWARAVGIGLAILTAIAGFLFLAFTPVWGVVIVAVSVFAIWGMAHDGGEHSTSV
jgi:hypothetical protein